MFKYGHKEVIITGIGKRLKEAREKAGFTQEELGRMIGVTGSSITNYEKETSHPKEPIMYALIDALQVEPNFLFQDCVNLPSKVKSPGTIEDVPGDEISRIFDALNSMLISAGLIKDGSDITKKQGEVLLAVCQIIDSTFKD